MRWTPRWCWVQARREAGLLSISETPDVEGTGRTVPTFIVALLIVAAIVLLASTLVSGRRDRDPAASVDSFQRAMSAMSSQPPRSAADHDDVPAGDGPSSPR